MAEPVPLDTLEHVGRKAFILFALERMRMPLLVLAIAVVLSIVSSIWPSMTLAYGAHDLYFIGFVLFLFILGWVWAEYANYTFILEKSDLVVHSGVLNKRQAVVPYSGIQSVAVVRGRLHRLLGLSTVTVCVALGEKPVEVSLDPLDKDRADAICAFLKAKAGIEEKPEEKSEEKSIDQ